MYHLEGENTPIVMNLMLSSSIPEFKDKDQAFLMADSSKANKESPQQFEGLFEKKPFLIPGISIEFSKLKTPEDILKFANSYGLLGLQQSLWAVSDYPYYYLNKFQYEKNYIESIKAWHWHIDHVYKLIKLYTFLLNDEDIEDLLYVGEAKNLVPPRTLLQLMWSQSNPHLASAQQLPSGGRIPGMAPPSSLFDDAEKMIPEEEYHYFWSDGTATLQPYRAPKVDMAKTAAKEAIMNKLDLKLTSKVILKKHILTFIEKGVYIDFHSVKVNEKSPLGFSFDNRKATDYLLAAIYYDLWRMVNNLEPVGLCKQCGKALILKRKDKEYCDKACTKRHEREPKKKSLGV